MLPDNPTHPECHPRGDVMLLTKTANHPKIKRQLLENILLSRQRAQKRPPHRYQMLWKSSTPSILQSCKNNLT